MSATPPDPTTGSINSVTGYIDSSNNLAYTNVSNLLLLRGVSVSTSDYYGYHAHAISRMGETITVYASSNYITVNQPSFSFDYTGMLDGIVNWNDIPVRLTARSIGADYIKWTSSPAAVDVDDFESNGIVTNLPTTLIAGSWINNWTSLDPLLASTTFSLKDFECMDENLQSSDPHCSHEVKVALGVIQALQNTKNLWNQQGHAGTFNIVKATNLSRGHRCWVETYRVGNGLSNHLSGKAVDFSPQNGTIGQLQTMIANNYQTLGWQGYEPFNYTSNWVHAQIVTWLSY